MSSAYHGTCSELIILDYNTYNPSLQYSSYIAKFVCNQGENPSVLLCHSRVGRQNRKYGLSGGTEGCSEVMLSWGSVFFCVCPSRDPQTNQQFEPVQYFPRKGASKEGHDVRQQCTTPEKESYDDMVRRMTMVERLQDIKYIHHETVLCCSGYFSPTQKTVRN